MKGCCGNEQYGYDNNYDWFICGWNLYKCNEKGNWSHSSTEKFAQSDTVPLRYSNLLCITLTAFLAVVVVLLLLIAPIDQRHDNNIVCTCDRSRSLPGYPGHCAGCQGLRPQIKNRAFGAEPDETGRTSCA